ncbi:oxidoreductase 2OG-Fe(II) oxygenase family protein [Apiospora arundinis]|uniref:Oxidoreductase 2OG-Fe(II) oxygenase family protein n=1 Tax=Apiospora arundinis TaxID=335852 RepID=A0ABR2IAM7_9PEZI
MGPTAERSPAKEDPLEALRLVLKNKSHLFACGGSLPVGEPTNTAEGATKVPVPTGDAKKQHDPITIRWDVNDSKDVDKLNLPLIPGAGVGGETSLKRLVQHCQPATFGRDGKDVYDESYRRASKMDPTAFCTTFNPYTPGIIDTVAQVLLPSVYDSVTHRGVRAELYKLNVYSAPSGKFKSHVDTPRSREQFGSLVVCLPVEHEGGQLKVRHKGEEMTFDWSTTRNNQNNQNKKYKSRSDSQAIHWAAFYSDCEHEVLEVTSGHRVTLTYNLYAVRGFQRLTGAALSPTPLSPAHLPLFDTIQRTMSQDPFDGQGGTLGFWCSHAYAHNHETESPLPDALKGVDAALWEIFQSLNLDPKIAPLMDMDSDYFQRLQESFEDHPNYDSDAEDERITGGRRHFGGIGLETMPSSEWIIGQRFGDVQTDGGQVETIPDFHYMYNAWGKYSPTPIHWLNKEPSAWELQLVYVAYYGNEPGTAIAYSSCAILVTILSKEMKDQMKRMATSL